MTYNRIAVSTAYGYTGKSAGSEKFGYFAKVLFAKDDFEIDTEADALLAATWATAINAENVFPFVNFVSVEPGNEDDVVEDLSTGIRLFVREGKVREKGYSVMSVNEMKEHRKFNNLNGRLFIVTSEGSILGYSPDGIKMKGFTLQQIMTGVLGPTDGTTVRKVGVSYSLQNPAEFGDYLVSVKPSWDPLDLEGLIEVDLSVDSAATDSIVVTVARVADDETVTGLVAADFAVTATAGTDEPIDTCTDNGDGTYTLAPTSAFATGTVNLLDPADQTTGGYVSSGSAAVSIT